MVSPSRHPPRDLARTGQLVLDAGVASGRQMVPAEWLHSASCRA
jgi:CubicO group peptidase (beta-lactamase class C family)